jgi:catechol 2,3-dioxygenase-like lactoylglutathione lyase family enzyme
MSILGIDGVTYGVTDLPKCKQFFLDWGLSLKGESGSSLDFEAMNGCAIRVRMADDASLPPAIESGPTVRQVVWGVESHADLEDLAKSLAGTPGFRADAEGVECQDPNGLAIRFQVTTKRKIGVKGAPVNSWDSQARVDMPSTIYDHATPIEVGHVVFFTQDLAGMTKFYTERCGFSLSDSYPNRGVFLRCSAHGGHHDIFLLSLPNKPKGLNHIAFSVRDIHEVMGGGMHINRCGWETEIGPGRHPISSAYFWYVKNPAGGLAEYYADDDVLTPNWKPRELEVTPENFAEWAVLGGLDGKTRRQVRGPVASENTTAGAAVRHK